MHLDVLDLRNFYYRTQLGRVAQRAIRDQVVQHWPPGPGQTVAGFGFAVPLLRPYLAEARRVIGLMPGPQGVMPWPAGMENVSVLCEDTAWPLPTGLVDRLVLMHGLETSENPSAVLEEAQRVLGPGGRALFIVPNRSGLWARAMARPSALAGPIRWRSWRRSCAATALPPNAASRCCLRPPGRDPVLAADRGFLGDDRPADARGWSGGVLMVEASKQVYAPTRGGLGRGGAPAAEGAGRHWPARGAPAPARAQGIRPATSAGVRSPGPGFRPGKARKARRCFHCKGRCSRPTTAARSCACHGCRG